MSQTIRTDLQFEQQYFKEVTAVVAETGNRLKADIEKAEADIKAMTVQYDEGEYDVASIIINTIDMKKVTEAALKRSQKIGNKPYFGRILFDDESMYIGRNGIHGEKITDQLVIDWRAPIANAYYENGLGEMKFRTPLGEDIRINLKLKRTFDIEDGRINGFFDSENTANDDLLNKYLAKNKQAVLGEIIATIQKEQNDIIRLSPRHNVLVQGAAGSGKTTVAMHRISYILYNYGDIVKPQDFYIIGSNKMLLNYITGVLPDLDVTGFRQMTMEEMFTRLMYEDWDPFLYRIKDVNRDGVNASVKGTQLFFDRLKEFLAAYEKRMISQEDVILEPNRFVEGIENGKIGVFDRREKPVARKGKEVCLLRGSAISKYIEANPDISMQQKIIALNNELNENLETELAGKVSYTEKEKKAIRSFYNQYFGKNEFKGSIYKIYDEFLDSVQDLGVPAPGKRLVEMLVTGSGSKYNRQKKEERKFGENLAYDSPEGGLYNADSGVNSAITKEKGGDVSIEQLEERFRAVLGLQGSSDSDENGDKKIKKYVTEYDIYELAALAYIYRKIHETQVISEAHHIVIDEAQDYGIMAYRVLNECVRECTYTIMGDVSQNIRYDSGINDWSELRSIFITGEDDSFMMLRKSYRNTVEISEFATNILDHGDFEVYPVEPIIRHGDSPVVEKVEPSELLERIVDQCRTWQAEELNTIAVVCRDEKEAAGLRGKLSPLMPLQNTDPDSAEFGNGVMVLPVTMTKGLEFDAVLIYEPTKRSYPMDNKHAKFLYVAATRALHRLTVLYTKSLSELISKPVPKDRVRHVINEIGGPRMTEEEKRELEDKKRLLMEADEELSKQKVLEEAARRTRAYMENRRGASAANVDARRGGGTASQTVNNPVTASYVSDGYGKATASSVSGSVGKATASPASGSAGKSKVSAVPGSTGPSAVSASPDGAAIQPMNAAGSFIREVPGAVLRPSGHAANSFATKWIQKKNDGIYLQSLYGVTRIQPVASNVVRISFCRGMEFKLPKSTAFKSYNMSKDFQYRESPQSVELTMKGMTVKFDRYRGACSFLDDAKKELLKENQNEPKYVDDRKKTTVCYTNFTCPSGDCFHILTDLPVRAEALENIGNNSEKADGSTTKIISPETVSTMIKSMKFLKDTAYYISPCDGRIPCIIKKDRYAIVPLTTSQTAFCKMPVVGTFLMQEDCYSDYYLISGKDTEGLVGTYLKLVK